MGVLMTELAIPYKKKPNTLTKYMSISVPRKIRNLYMYFKNDKSLCFQYNFKIMLQNNKPVINT